MKLILIRGLPGSGKTTIVEDFLSHRSLADPFKTTEWYHLETDQFFTGSDGVYRFDRNRAGEGHRWCEDQTRAHLTNKHNVIVSNTFTTRSEMQPYFDMAAKLGIEVEVIEATGDFGSTHGVPDEIVEKMRARWETIE